MNSLSVRRDQDVVSTETFRAGRAAPPGHGRIKLMARKRGGLVPIDDAVSELDGLVSDEKVQRVEQNRDRYGLNRCLEALSVAKSS